jgi:hypothetical protein
MINYDNRDLSPAVRDEEPDRLPVVDGDILNGYTIQVMFADIPDQGSVCSQFTQPSW